VGTGGMQRVVGWWRCCCANTYDAYTNDDTNADNAHAPSSRSLAGQSPSNPLPMPAVEIWAGIVCIDARVLVCNG